MPPARGYWDQMMETDILSKNDTYHAINPAYPDTCCIHHLRYRSTYPYPLSSAIIRMDADSTRGKDAHKKLLEQFDAADCAVLLARR